MARIADVCRIEHGGQAVGARPDHRAVDGFDAKHCADRLDGHVDAQLTYEFDLIAGVELIKQRVDSALDRGSPAIDRIRRECLSDDAA
jgi:hypothetical protein